MNSKGIIAIIVVVILVAAGVGVGVFFANQNNKAGDGVKGNVVVGDNISLNYIASTEDTRENVSNEEFLSTIYTNETGESVQCMYEGTTYDCYEIVQGDMTIYALQPNEEKGIGGGFIIKMIYEKYEEYGKATATVSTNLDFKLSMDEQSKKLDVGSMYDIDIAIDSNSPITFNDSKIVSEHDKTTEMNKVSHVFSTITTTNYKVKEISEDGKTLTFEDGATTMSTLTFRSFVSKDDWEKQMKEQGATYELKSSSTEKMQTAFGERDVIIDVYSVEQSVLSYEYTIIHSEKGFIYETSADMGSGILIGEIINETSMRTS